MPDQKPPGLHVGICLPNYGSEMSLSGLERMAVESETAGYDSVWVTDHVAVDSTAPAKYRVVSEALVTLGYVAAITKTVKLGISALVIPPRQPLLTLKQITSLDWLSQGRLIVCLAVGWVAGEFRNLGSEFRGRNQRLDDWIELADSAFRQMPGPVHHTGVLSVEDAWFAPGLEHPGGPEWWAAGTSSTSLRRAVRLGTWHPTSMPFAQFKPKADELRQYSESVRIRPRLILRFAAASQPSVTERTDRAVIVGPPEWIALQLRQYVAEGADGFVIAFEDGGPDDLHRFAQQVRPLLG